MQHYSTHSITNKTRLLVNNSPIQNIEIRIYIKRTSVLLSCVGLKSPLIVGVHTVVCFASRHIVSCGTTQSPNQEEYQARDRKTSQ